MKSFIIVLGLCLSFCLSKLDAETFKKQESKDEFLLGLWLASKVVEQQPLIHNHPDEFRLQKALSRILAVRSSGDQRLFSVQIIKAPVANAFALPGGFLFVTDKLLEQKLNDHEMGFLMGHEVAHVHRNHFDQIRKEAVKVQFAKVLATLGAVLLAKHAQSSQNRERIESQGGGLDMSGRPQEDVRPQVHPALLPILFGDVYGTLYILHSQRGLEIDADRFGGRLALEAGYEAKGGEGLLEKLFYMNYRNANFEKWQTHPLTQARLTTYELVFSGQKPVQPWSELKLDDFRDQQALRWIQAYEEMPKWSLPSHVKSKDIPKLRKLILKRAQAIAGSSKTKAIALRKEVYTFDIPDIEKESFLKIESGRVLKKLRQLQAWGEPIDEKELAKIQLKKENALKYELEREQKSKMGLAWYQHMLLNHSDHDRKELWEWEAWRLEPQLRKKIEKFSFLAEGNQKKAMLELLKLKTRLEDPITIKLYYQILNQEIDLKKLKDSIKQCKSIKVLAQFQTQFPQDERIPLVLQRKDELAEQIWRKGRIERTSNNPERAVRTLHRLLLYDAGSEWEEKARDLIARINSKQNYQKFK